MLGGDGKGRGACTCARRSGERDVDDVRGSGRDPETDPGTEVSTERREGRGEGAGRRGEGAGSIGSDRIR